MTKTTISRRHMLKATGAVAAGMLAPSLLRAAPATTQRPLNIALIGTAGRAHNTIRDFCKLDANVVALCDVDLNRLASGVKLAAERFPDARQYQDYRKLLDAEKELDGVVVTTPDHMHAPISLLAMSRGLHVFCEKPLTRTVWEARQMAAAAKKAGVVTQMGTQLSAQDSVRRTVELLKAGVLGPVREIHIWCDRKSEVPAPSSRKSDDVPNGLDWDLWLGVAKPRPYQPVVWHPFRWRWWTDFGAGPLGDMGCHLTNAAFRGLDLVEPAEIDVEVNAPQHPGMFPLHEKITYKFPERNGRAPLSLTWYDGGWMPSEEIIASSGIREQFKKVDPTEQLIIGDKGMILGASLIKLTGEKSFVGFDKHEACLAVPQTLPRNAEQNTVGHYREWLDACRGTGQTFTPFELGAAQTEMVLLGCVAAQLGHKIRWDAAKMSIPGEPAADALLRPTYRPGFTVA